MGDKSISWVSTISDELEEKGPVSFTPRRLEKQEHLFAHRSALFYTPTENIPFDYIGSGLLDIILPVAPPDWIAFFEIPAYRSPRFWVDLIQRQTGKLRWHPISPARVIFTRYDCYLIRPDYLYTSVKGVLDALKVRTTGRRDRIYLYYFGAIIDDGHGFIELSCDQALVEHPKESGVRIQVLPKESGRYQT
jgi:hypothetical protein